MTFVWIRAARRRVARRQCPRRSRPRGSNIGGVGDDHIWKTTLGMGTSSTPAAAPVPHLSVAERIARGKAAREEVPRSRHARFEPPRDRAIRSRCSSIRPRRASRAGSDPLRQDAGLAVHVLSRGGEDHGPRLRRHAALGAACPVLRRRAPVELRRLRFARATARVRHQRL